MKVLAGNTTFFFMLLLVSCSSGQNSKEQVESKDTFNYGDNLEEGVLGTWKNTDIDVEISTYNNTDTSFNVVVNESSWRIIMNMNPIYTWIKEDGTFYTEYRDTLNQVFHTTKGIWYIDGDSLFLKDEKGFMFPYKVLIKDDEMEMKTLVDYDEDGKKDDFYFGKYRKVKE